MRRATTSALSCARVFRRCSSAAMVGGRMKTLTRSVARALRQLLRALPVDVEQHVAPGRQRLLDRARAACRTDGRTPWRARGTRSRRPCGRRWRDRRNDSRRRPARWAASAAWWRRSRAPGPARSPAAGARSWSCRRPMARTAPASGRAAESRPVRWPCPRQSHACAVPRLLDILRLLAQLLDGCLKLDAEVGQGQIIRLGAEGIGLAIELLAQEIELAARSRRPGPAARAPRRHGR